MLCCFSHKWVNSGHTDWEMINSACDTSPMDHWFVLTHLPSTHCSSSVWKKHLLTFGCKAISSQCMNCTKPDFELKQTPVWNLHFKHAIVLLCSFTNIKFPNHVLFLNTLISQFSWEASPVVKLDSTFLHYCIHASPRKSPRARYLGREVLCPLEVFIMGAEWC